MDSFTSMRPPSTLVRCTSGCQHNAGHTAPCVVSFLVRQQTPETINLSRGMMLLSLSVVRHSIEATEWKGVLYLRSRKTETRAPQFPLRSCLSSLPKASHEDSTYFCFFEDRISLCNSLDCPATHFCRPGWPRTHRDLLASAS